ncbi:DUF4153 domain-containing protein [Leucothrix arctica]|uniref:Uncharacterized protein n=1 Tax=Leucothrix arctica TaxID=1481894 RepID=A0A317CHZ4_9GAMM|nr:DUF4153 domain-containing protein [Leucothrix arctica]PWQ97781.1 hypothetical protein DKT75_05815 [Leucothrix arctica]
MTFNNQTVLSVTTLAVFAVLGHWGFWSEGVFALGFNTTAFWVGFGALLWVNNPSLSWKKDWVWLVPLALMALSFSLFENPWLKVISCVVLPISAGTFYAYSQLINAQQSFWGLQLVRALLKRCLTPMRHISAAFHFCRGRVAFVAFQQDHNLNKRIFTGLGLLAPLALLVLILLGSADDNFAELTVNAFTNFFGALNLTMIAKVLCIFIMCVLLFAGLYAWKTKFEFTEEKVVISLDDVVVGIVMGGVLVIYCLFLWLQLDYLLIGSLPENFTATEKIVKSGFWQLFFLTILNTGLFFAVYKNTGAAAQVILRVFIVASGLLLLSAAWRMGLYVYWYGFSYEKYFASYTSLFALLVFIYLLAASFSKTRKDVFKFIAFAALWSYSVATVTPVERIIFNSNVALSQLSDSRVGLYELRQMSADIVGDVKSLVSDDNLAGRLSATEVQNWTSWIYNQERKHCGRAWYESNVSLLSACP